MEASTFNDAAKECLGNPNCAMFVMSQAGDSFRGCAKTAIVYESSRKTTLYTKNDVKLNYSK